MRGAIRFDRPTCQQQPKNYAEHELFLFGQAIHVPEYSRSSRNNNVGV